MKHIIEQRNEALKKGVRSKVRWTFNNRVIGMARKAKKEGRILESQQLFALVLNCHYNPRPAKRIVFLQGGAVSPR